MARRETSDVSKPYREMTTAERVAARIEQNRKIEQSVTRQPLAHGLGGIVARLHERKQRASCGAVADLPGVLPRGLMSGPPEEPRVFVDGNSNRIRSRLAHRLR
jgi:hypothetical protein